VCDQVIVGFTDT